MHADYEKKDKLYVNACLSRYCRRVSENPFRSGSLQDGLIAVGRQQKGIARAARLLAVQRPAALQTDQ